MSRGRLLLKNCKIVVTHDKILKNCSIAIDEGVIKKIGRRIKNDGYDAVIDCRNKVVAPALFNAHTHASMVLLRGYRDDQELHSWLKDVWKVEARLKPKDIYAGALFACMEMAKTGTFCFVDMYFEMEEVARAVEEVGLKAFLGYGMIDLKDEEKREREIKRTERFVDRCRKFKSCVPVLAPHAIYTCSKELLEWVRDFARENDLYKTMHLSETRKEVYDCVRENKCRPVEYLDKIGFLDEKTLLFHASWVTKGEIGILAKRGSAVVSCAASNMKLATGGAFPLREYREAGVRVMLGTDGACSNNSLDMFVEMKFFSLLQKWSRWNGEEVKARETLRYATLSPCAFFGLNAGDVKEGMEANLMLLDASHFSLQPLENVISNMVYSARGDCVSDLIVAGEIVLMNGRLCKVDEEKVRRIFYRRYRRLMVEEDEQR